MPTVMPMSERTLLLLRHAKSDYPTGWPTMTGRWRRAVSGRPDWPATGCERTHPPIDAVLCSTATRTRADAGAHRNRRTGEFVDRLYDATPGAVIDEINGVGDRRSTRPCW